MKVALLTSELYPVFSGGLGVAVYEMVRHSRRINRDVNFIVTLPQLDWKGDLDAEVLEVPHQLAFTTYTFTREFNRPDLDWDAANSIKDFNTMMAQLLLTKEVDVVHANDWMTILGGMELKRHGKRLVFHIHSTEYDRTNDSPRPWVVDLEREGIHLADAVVTTSQQMKQQLINRYGADPAKVHVVYNGIDVKKFRQILHIGQNKPGEKVVLFVGRLTVQKGVWELLHAARLVIEKDPEVKFLIVGGGEWVKELIKLAIDLGIQNHVIFTGRVSEDELLAAYRICDLFVMPSVSEPFGIVALEAMASGKPVLVSKTSGVSEVVQHCLTVDYWDTQLMASKILEALNYPVMAHSLVRNGAHEIEKLDWAYSARKLHQIYGRLKG
ncbi:MAG TPA: glycosyltransferase family 1 protein [archaeon]|nr:glycosyltransferase family 1 protein [archaeon]